MKRFDTLHDVRRRVLEAPGIWGSVVAFRDPDVVQAVKDPIRGYPRLGSNERSSWARVSAAPERHMLPSVRAVRMELPRAFETAFVPVGRAKEKDK